MRRVALLISLVIRILVAPPTSDAQPRKVYRVGMLGPAPRLYSQTVAEELRTFGYVEGENLVIDYRFGSPAQLSRLVSELIRLNPDVIHARSSAAVRAAMNATRKIPIVAVDLETDPVASGFAATLARPAGNLTGFFLNFPEFTAKRLEVLKETAPTISRVAVLWDSFMDRAPLSGMESAARSLNLRVNIVEVRDDSDFEAAFKRVTELRADALMVMPSTRLDGYKPRILRLAAIYRLPVVTLFAHFTEDGGLLTYGPNSQDLLRRSATYVDKILKGAKPGDLPIQRPAKFDFVINLKTAKTLGLTIPNSVLLRADEVIR
jgi:putative ABC transport system substrate-binding protein